MSHGHPDTHGGHGSHEIYAAEEIKKPKPKEILGAKSETLLENAEALAAAEQFLLTTSSEFGRMFGELNLERCSERELENFREKYDKIIAEVELILRSGVVDEKSKKLERLKLESQERTEKMTAEQERKREIEKSESEFLSGLQNSDIPLGWAIDAFEKVNEQMLSDATIEPIITVRRDLFSPRLKQMIEEREQGTGNFNEEVEKAVRKLRWNIEDLTDQEKNIFDRFDFDPENRSLKLRQLKEDLQKMERFLSDPFRVDQLRLDGKLGEAERLQQSIKEEYSRLENEEFDIFETKEKARIDAQMTHVLGLINKERKSVDDRVYDLVKQEVPGAIVEEAFFVKEFALVEVSKSLAEKILKEKGGIENIDMQMALSLPETVLDAMVDTLGYAEIAAIMNASENDEENLPPIYWSKSFEKKIQNLEKKYGELERGSLATAFIHAKDLTPGQTAEFASKQADLSKRKRAIDKADLAGKYDEAKTASGEYNQFFVPELLRVLEMKQIREALAGEVDEDGLTTLVVHGKREISLKNDELLLDGKLYPGSGHNTSSGPLTFHRPYGFEESIRYRPEEHAKPDFEMAAKWVASLIDHQVPGNKNGEVIQYRKNDADGLRRSADIIDKRMNEKVQPVKEIIDEFTLKFEDLLLQAESRDDFDMVTRAEARNVNDQIKRIMKYIDDKEKDLLKPNEVFSKNINVSPAQRQLSEAKQNFFDRIHANLRKEINTPMERLVGNTKEDFEGARKFFQDRTRDLQKEMENFEDKNDELRVGIKEFKQKQKALREAVLKNLPMKYQFSFFKRSLEGYCVEKVDDEYQIREKPISKKEVFRMEEESTLLKNQIEKMKKELEELPEQHDARKKIIESDLKELERVFPRLGREEVFVAS